MNPILKHILVGIFCFSCGIASTLLWFGWSRTANAPQNVSSVNKEEELPILAYCELANNPDKYDGKVVRVSARLLQGIHGLSFLDPNCEGEIRQAAVTFDHKREEQIEAQIAAETNSEKYAYWGFPQIIAAGRFSKATPSRQSDSNVDNSYLRFEILSIDSAVNTRKLE